MKNPLTATTTFVKTHLSTFITILSILAGIVFGVISRKEPTVPEDIVLELDEDHAKKMLVEGGTVVFEDVKSNGPVRVQIVKHLD